MPFEIIRADISKVRADAIVVSANPKPLVLGGTDSAIYGAAGRLKLLWARQKIGSIERGKAACTPAFDLPAKYVIHTVGPVWKGGTQGERETLAACYANSLALANELKCESVAFPLISTAIYGFPKDEALKIALGEIERFLLEHEMKVTLVVFDPSSFELSRKLIGGIEQYIDEHTYRKLEQAEYSADEYTNARGYRNAERNMSLSNRVAGVSDKLRERRARRAERRMPEPLQTPEEEPLWDEDEFIASMPECAIPSESIMAQKSAEDAAEHDLCSAFMPEEASADDAVRDVKLPKALPAEVPYLGKPREGMSLDDWLDSREESFQQRLFRLIDQSGMDDVTVYKKANIDRKVFSSIRCKSNYKPKKKTAVAFAIALELDMDTMKDLLARAEIAFSPSNKFDLIVSYFVSNKNYDIYEINAALFKYGQPILGE